MKHTFSWFLPSAYVVRREGNSFTFVCQSTRGGGGGGGVSQPGSSASRGRGGGVQPAGGQIGGGGGLVGVGRGVNQDRTTQ